jgi:hypothetical protein
VFTAATIVRKWRAGLPRGATDGAGLPPQIDVQADHEVHAGSHGSTFAARGGLVNAGKAISQRKLHDRNTSGISENLN